MATAIGNIHVGLTVNTGQTRAFSSAANAISRDSERMRVALGGTSRSVHTLRSTMNQGWRSRIFGDMIRQASQANNEVAKLRATMLTVSALTGTSVTGAFAATFLLQTADQANRLNNQLRTVSTSEENLIAVRERLYAISQVSRSDMAATITLYSRLSRAAQEFGTSQEDVIRVTETIQKAFAIGGASQAEAQGAAVQLSQGIASDRFSGDEYRSVSENAPVLLQQMAKHLGVTIGKLREMAHAGELTGKVVTEAILGASAAIDQDFNKTITTVGQSLTKVGNAFLMYIGETDASVGVTRRLSEALGNLAENFDKIVPLLSVVGGGVAALMGGRLASKFIGAPVRNIVDSTRATRENAAAVMAGNAVTLNSAKANLLRTSAIKASAAATLEATKTAVANGAADVAALRQTIAMTAAQRARAIATMELNRGVAESTGRSGPYNSALKAMNDSSRTLLTTQRVLRESEVALANNKALLVRQSTLATAASTAHNAALAATTVRARAASVAMSAMRASMALAQRAGAGLLGLMGGWTGVAFTAAIVGLSMYAANAAKAQERTAKLTKELHTLGLISDEVAGVTEQTVESLDALGASALRNKLREVADEIERMKGTQNIFEQMFSYDEKMLGNMLSQLDKVRAGFTPDGRGVNTLSTSDKSAAESLRSIIEAAQSGTDTVEGLQGKLDSLSEQNPDMAGWIDEMIQSLQQSLPYMDGLQTRAEQLGASLSALDSSGISTGWLTEIQAQTDALQTAADAAATIRDIADEMVRTEGLSEQEARIEKVVESLRKEAKERDVIAGITQYGLEMEAKRVVAAEDAAAAAKESAKAQDDFNKQVGELSTELDNASSKFEDLKAAATIKRLLADFATGAMSAEKLKNRLAEVNSVNLSDPMDTLIAKIIAAIGPLSTLLGVFQGFGGGPASLGSSPSGPVNSRGSVGRSRRELAAKQGIGQKVMDSAVADAGLSERDAWIKDKTAELNKQAQALGGVTTNAEATAAALWDLDQKQKDAKTSGKDSADSAKKYAEGMAKLNQELAAAPLDPFLKEVLASAESMGIATGELDAFVAAVSSGGIDAAPEKFKKIASAMQEIKAINIMQDLQFEQDQMFRSDTEQRVADTMRSSGLSESDPYGAMVAGQIRFNDAMKTGKDLASTFFGSMKSDLMSGTSLTESLGNAFGKLGDQLIQMALDQAINGLFSMLMGAFGGGFGGGSSLKLGFNGIPGYAVGTNDHPGGLAQLFERGAEIIDLPKHTRVIPHELSKQMAQGGSSSGVGDITITNQINVPAGTSADVAPAIAREVTKELRRQIPDAIQSYNRNPLRRVS